MTSTAGSAGLAIASAHSLALLAAAIASRLRTSDRSPAGPSARRFLVLVPAHNEEPVIGPTIASLAALDYPPEQRTIVAIADNCTDETASRARDAGATVFERTDPSLTGKGRALAWALDRASRELEYDSIVIVDADCHASDNLLSVISEYLDAGHRAVQVDYVVGDPERSWSVALRFAAMSLMNTVRPLGKTRLRLSSGLLGTGMGFPRETLETLPWNAFSIVEDAEYHNNLVAIGISSVFAPEARVTTEMPTSLNKSKDQQMRWEGGRSTTVRQSLVPLVRAGIRLRDPVRVHAGIEWLLPPQSMVVAGQAAFGALALITRARIARRLIVFTFSAQCVYVLGGLLLIRAPIVVFKALFYAPFLVIQKIAIYLRLLAGSTPDSFVRTERNQPRTAGATGE